MKETIQRIGDKIDLVTIVEPKFKTHTISVMLLLPIDPQQNAARALALSMLTASCRKYPNNAAMTIQQDNLYGVNLSSTTGFCGGAVQYLITGSTIANQFALHGENLLDELLTLLTDCIFDPNTDETGKAFCASEFRIQRKELLDAIQAEINNKRGYALTRARRIALQGEPDAYPLYGTKEDAEQLTPENAFAAYQDMLHRAVIRIYHVTPEPSEQAAARFQEAFGKLQRNPVQELPIQSHSPLKTEPVSETEPMDVVQSKLVLAFKGENLHREALRLFNVMFGGTPYSMLFMNVREKQSLCYYCASRILTGKNTLMVDSGVELVNADRTREAILEQLENMQHGNFPDTLLENAQRTMTDALRGIGDTPFSCISESFERFYTGDDANPEERIRRYQALTREDIITTANALHLDTVYLMQQKQQEEVQA